MNRRFMVWLACMLVLLAGIGGGPSLALAATPTTVAWAETDVEMGAFQQALVPNVLEFPRDLGAHPDYQLEWWYYTGNLETANGRLFGFELTFFRNALVPTSQLPVVNDASPWRTNQVYSAHFTLSDIAQNQFYASERFSRASVGLTGAAAAPYHVWLEDWNVTEIAPETLRLQAAASEAAVDLVLQITRPPVPQGDRGLLAKGPKPGQASYYYSIVQQATTGTLRLRDRDFEVSGVTWMDHEYPGNSMPADVAGWDWFSAQFDNGAALMLYLLRRSDGSTTAASSGAFIAPDGTQTAISQDEFQINILDTWVSRDTKSRYPARWQVSIPAMALTLDVQPLMSNQELNTLAATYWEGASRYDGEWRDQPIHGRGYVELTGYAENLKDSSDRILTDMTAK